MAERNKYNWVLMVLGFFMFTCQNIIAQQDSTRKSIFRVKSVYSRNNSISFEKDCPAQGEAMAIFVGKNGDAYLYWIKGPMRDSSSWDSVSISADTANVNAVKRIITSPFIATVNECADDFRCGYSIGITENGKRKYYTGLDVKSAKKNSCGGDKLTTLIKILDEEYRKRKKN